ncbi:MAG: hypothetical protein AAF790_01485 [Planctomycetota bacterium]
MQAASNNCSPLWRTLSAAAIVIAALISGPASGQAVGPSALEPATTGPGVTPKVEPREFAPGVETFIPVEINPEEATAVHDLVEIRAQRGLNWKPKLVPQSRTLYRQAEQVRFRRDVWNLDFGFKPLRMIFVDLPTRTGEMRRTLVWYLVYRVDNRSDALSPSEEQDGYFSVAPQPAQPRRFLPHFVLEGQDVDDAGNKLYRAYLDRVIPAAVEPIRRRELPGRRLLTSTQMAEQPIPVGSEDDEQTVWGVATWTDIDPEMDFFSVFVRGLTNAYRWRDPQGAYTAGDAPGTGRRFVRKTLQLNFWRPGDQFLEHESEVRYGVAPGKASLYGVKPGVAHKWVYR